MVYQVPKIQIKNVGAGFFWFLFLAVPQIFPYTNRKPEKSFITHHKKEL
jgi:hypothetical protein